MKYQYYNGLKFTKDNITGYYLNSTNRIRMHRYVWECENGKISEGYDIHHKDHNKANNNISNLELMSEHEHCSYHSKKWHTENKSKVLEHLDSIRDMTKEWHGSKDGLDWHKQHYENMKEKLHVKSTFVCEQCGKEYIAVVNGHNRFCSEKCKSKWRRDSGIDNEERECIICGNKFTVNKYSKAKCCSRKCAGKSRKTIKNKIN